MIVKLAARIKEDRRLLESWEAGANGIDWSDEADHLRPVVELLEAAMRQMVDDDKTIRSLARAAECAVFNHNDT
jgi:hypothetical protein